MQDVFVSIILLNYNGEKYLPSLFRSLLKQTYKNFEIIVVDNNSKDRSMEVILEYKDLFEKQGIAFKLLPLKKNTGYCLGNNLGALIADKKAEYLVFLNNDTIVENDWLLGLVEFMEKHRDVGAASSLILFNYTNRIDNSGGLADVYGECIGRGLLEHRDVAQKHSELEGFFYASGCSMIVQKELFRKVMGFDPRLFMYHDDLDLSWRIRLLGYRIGFVRKSVCHHMRKPGFGAKLPIWKFYLAYRNRVRVLIKNYELWNIITKMPKTIIIIVAAGVFLSILSRNAYYLLYSIKAFLWNLKKMKDTLLQRKYVQKLRRVRDNLILQYMEKKPIGIWHGKAYLRLTK